LRAREAAVTGRFVCVMLLCAAMLGARAGDGIAPGEALPPLTVDDIGELVLRDDEVEYSPWKTVGMAGGRVHVIQYMAARMSAKAMNEPFTERLKAAKLPLDRYHVTTIVNVDDAMFGTRGFVMAELESNKRRYFKSTIVADARGEGLRVWSLQPRSSAIIIVDPDHRVRFFREGALSEPEIGAALDIVRDGISRLAASTDTTQAPGA
jgi:YtfJ family uncharacterized protein